MNVICLWSAGKDSCLAVYKAKQEGHTIVSLVNFTDIQRQGSLSHGLTGEIIRRQAALTAMPFSQIAMPKEGYRANFIALINEWKIKKAVDAIVFGDIYLQGHKDWIDGVCKEAGVMPIMPLWGRDAGILINEFIDAGFKALVVSVKTDVLGQEWLGREVDNKFVEELKALGGIDLCGEKGEFHTYVYDGPIFKHPVKFVRGDKTSRDMHCFLELLPLKS
jgi:uncharacterized protein (TIGR00290 family)